MQAQNELAEYRQKMYRIVIPCFVVICFIAIILNFCMILALRRTKIRNAVVTLILSLTVSDISTSSIVALSLLYNSYLPNVQNTSVNPCISLTLENLRSAGLLTGAFHLLLIALNHYTSIVKPHLSKKQLRKIATALCILAWTLPILALILLSLSFENQGYYNCIRVDFYSSRAFRTTVSGILATIFIIIILCYAKILYLLRRQTSKVKSKSTESRVFRILWTAVMICASYFFGWFPALTVFLLTCNTCDLLREQKFRTIFFLSCIQLAFILIKSILNPTIYTLRIPEVNFEARQCLSKCGKRLNRFFVPKSNSTSKDGSTGIRFAPEDRLLEDDQPLWSEKPTDSGAQTTDKNSSLLVKNTIVRT